MTLDSEFVHGALFIDVGWHPNEVLGDHLDFGDGQADIHERLESDRQVVALRLRTSDRALELAMHQVHNHRLRPFQVSFP